MSLVHIPIMRVHFAAKFRAANLSLEYSFAERVSVCLWLLLCLGGRVVGAGLACDMADLFVNTEYEGGRHDARLAAIKDIENEY